MALREVYHTYQQLALFEDHARELASGTEPCPDCLFKHTNKIEAYAREVNSLTADPMYLQIAQQAREWRKKIFEKGPPEENPRKHEPYGLTERERRDKARVSGRCTATSRNRFCRLVRCIKMVEARCRRTPEKCPESPVAVCRASVYGR